MRVPIALYVRGYLPEDWKGKLVARFNFGDFSHVSLVFEYEDHTEEEFESRVGKGVDRHVPYTGRLYYTYKVPVEGEALKRILVRTKAIQGKYDGWGIFGFVVRKAVHNIWKWFCSEYVCFALWETYPISRREPYRETPSTVCESLRLKRAPEKDSPRMEAHK